MRREFLLVFAILVILSRVITVFCIHPGNAPDEFGHMTIATALSNGKVLNMQEEKEYSGYPYSMYNPFGYVPAAVILAISSLKDPKINQMKKPMDFSFTANYVARLGQIFWTLLYVFFLVLLVKNDSLLIAGLKGVFLGFLPQIVFVQSYVNLDAAGLPIFLYLIWSLQNRKLAHVAISVFLLMNCKLNYYCAFALPFACFLVWYRHDFRLLVKNGVVYMGIPMVLGSSWFLYNHFFNLKQFGGFAVLQALRTFGNEHPPRWAAISMDYLNISVKSAFGWFGYMNQALPSWVYWVWRLGIFAPASIIMLALACKSLRATQAPNGPDTSRKDEAILLGMFATLALNFIIHFYTGFTTFYQPQGRYLFPAMIAILLTFAQFIGELPSSRLKLRNTVAVLVVSFFVLSNGISTYIMSQNPFKVGFGITLNR